VSIADVMVKGDAVPVSAESATIREALVAMSRAGLGFINVLDAQGSLVGVFTDGDLRRALDRDVDIKTAAIDTVMAVRFVTARPTQLAVEAVELMEQHKISALPVVDDQQRVVGAINMRLLLQAGVV
jgi:arabinose-5-phosphate isomerase